MTVLINGGNPYGQEQIFEKAITADDNSGANTVGTVTGGDVMIIDITLKAVTAAGANLVSAPITAGPGGIITLFDAVQAALVNLNANGEQLSNNGNSLHLASAETVVITLNGGGAPAPVDFLVLIKFISVNGGGYIA